MERLSPFLAVEHERPREPGLLPALLDPSLVAMSPLAFTLSGLERVEERDYAQKLARSSCLGVSALWLNVPLRQPA